jgi:Txe/YoeB family toxin of Txe-Axe toxin-antitoxin module
MNLRLKILVTDNALGFFEQKFFGTLWTSEFDFELLDPNKTYDIKQCVIWIDQYEQDNWIQPYQDAGYKIIYNYLWDSNVNDPAEVTNNVLKLRARNWIWMIQHFMFTNFGYEYTVQPSNIKYFMLMLMNLRRAHRNQALASMQKFLPASLYSYVGRGIRLDDDDSNPIGSGKLNDQFFNPRWYSQTAFSMVIETSVDSLLFISEKSFKPLAHRHPFVIYGCPETLVYLKNLGFQTFDHIIDESYDLEPNLSWSAPNSDGDYTFSTNRLNKIYQILDNLYKEFEKDPRLFADPESLRRIEHNYRLFYNVSLVEQMWIKEIITPIKEFASA